MTDSTEPSKKGQDFEQVLDGSDTKVAEFEVIHHTPIHRLQHLLPKSLDAI